MSTLLFHFRAYISFPFLNSYPRIFLLIFFRERRVSERERERRGRERNINFLLSISASMGDWTHNLGMYTDWGWSCNLLVHRTMLQPTEPPDQDSHLFKFYSPANGIISCFHDMVSISLTFTFFFHVVSRMWKLFLPSRYTCWNQPHTQSQTWAPLSPWVFSD